MNITGRNLFGVQVVVDFQLDFIDEAIIQMINNRVKRFSKYSAEPLFSYINADIKIKKDGVKLAYLTKWN